MPTLIVWGQQDRLVPVGAAYSYERRIPDSELHLIDDTGHMVQLERPARFNKTRRGLRHRKTTDRLEVHARTGR